LKRADADASSPSSTLQPFNQTQCRCGLPGAHPQLPHPPPPPALPADLLLLLSAFDAKVENFFASLAEPQWGHFVPFQSLERTRISLSRSHLSQWNS